MDFVLPSGNWLRFGLLDLEKKPACCRNLGFVTFFELTDFAPYPEMNPKSPKERNKIKKINNLNQKPRYFRYSPVFTVIHFP